MTIECYFSQCGYHSAQGDPASGPFCYEEQCLAPSEKFSEWQKLWRTKNRTLGTEAETNDSQVLSLDLLGRYLDLSLHGLRKKLTGGDRNNPFLLGGIEALEILQKDFGLTSKSILIEEGETK